MSGPTDRGRWPRRLAAFASVILLCLPTGLTPAASEPATPAPSPAAPSDVRVSWRSDMAVVSWSAADAGPWLVEISPDYPSPQPRRIEALTPTALITGLSDATRYHLRVRSALPDGSPGSASGWVNFTTAPEPYPAAAPELDLEVATSTSLSASWTTTPLAASYEIASHPCQDPSAGTRRTVEAAGTILDDLARETSYCARVRALDDSGAAVSDWSDTAKARTTDSLPLRVATYNITCYGCGGKGHSWAGRRQSVAAAIRGEAPDILGIQEASPGKDQAEDLVGLLGSPYRLHSTARSAGGANRIIYNSDTVELLDFGARPMESGKYDKRYVLWGLFEQKSTGKKVFFTTTHLEPGKGLHAVRLRQVSTVLATIRQHRPDGVPSIVVGDFNTHKFISGGNKAYDRMLANGYVDPLGNSYRSKGITEAAIAEKRVNTDYYSFNDFKRAPSNLPGSNGINVDYIFVEPMRVSEYETVVKLDDDGRLVGTIPADHNMLRATVWLP